VGASTCQQSEGRIGEGRGGCCCIGERIEFGIAESIVMRDSDWNKAMLQRLQENAFVVELGAAASVEEEYIRGER